LLLLHTIVNATKSNIALSIIESIIEFTLLVYFRLPNWVLIFNFYTI